MRAPFSPADAQDVRNIVFGITVTSIDRYDDDLKSAGFVAIATTGLTDDWAPYAAERPGAWRKNRVGYAQVHGEGAYAAQALFYATIARLYDSGSYDSGSLGGVRLVARVR